MVNWVQRLEDKVSALAKEVNVELTPGIVLLLEKFGDLVESESRAHNSFKNRLRRLNSELVVTGQVVRREVSDFRRAHVDHRDRTFWNRPLLRVYQHAETYLPVVHYQPNEDVPEMIIHVGRTYCNSRKGATYGLCSYGYCRGRLTGAIAQAANFLREHCSQRQWQLSVSELLKVWTDAIVSIPLEQRIQSRDAHRAKRRQVEQIVARRIGRWREKVSGETKNGSSESVVNLQTEKSIQSKKSGTILGNPSTGNSLQLSRGATISRAIKRSSTEVINIDDNGRDAVHVRATDGSNDPKSSLRSAPTPPSHDLPSAVGITDGDDKHPEARGSSVGLRSFPVDQLSEVAHPCATVVNKDAVDGMLESAGKNEASRNDEVERGTSVSKGMESDKHTIQDPSTNIADETIGLPSTDFSFSAEQLPTKKRRIIKRGQWKPKTPCPPLLERSLTNRDYLPPTPSY